MSDNHPRARMNCRGNTIALNLWCTPQCEKKGKVVPVKATQAHGGEEMKLILNLGSRWRLVFTFTPRLLYRRKKSPRYQLNKTQTEEEKYLLPCLLTIPTK
jgi:hypothetical protein